MIALALRGDWGEEHRGLLRWILPASIAIHIAVFAWMPSVRRTVAALPPPPLVLEVVEPPPIPTPLPSPPTPAPTQPAPIQQPTPAIHRVARDVAPPSQAPTLVNAAPIDFTSTVFSNDGFGIAVGAGPRAAAAPVVASARSVSQAPSPPPQSPIVEASSLARRPRAPGLDAELERHYPIEARRSGISGSAVLRVRILPDGRIGDVRIMTESWTGFGPACEKTVRAAHWEPPIDRNGAPVATEITYTCRFEVRS